LEGLEPYRIPGNETAKTERLRLPDLRIRTKQREVVGLTPNAVQELYLETLLPQWREKPVGLRGVREILLKARQFGFSTLILALFFLDTITHPNTQTVVIAHDTESTERLFQMVHRFHKLLPDELRPRTKYSNRREILWTDLDSYFFVGTAGSGEFGRGGTINNVHGSECAFWPDAREIVAGLLQAVPADGNVFLETTANGMANWYYDEYQLAQVEESRFTPRFFPWFLHGEYRDAVPAGFERTPEERVLVDRYGLDDEQLVWRRTKVKELREKFAQEYPANAEEAFVSTGGRVLSEFVAQRAPQGHLVADFLPPRTWRHFLVIDPGWNTAGHLFAAVDPDGRLWLYGEHYAGELLPADHMAVLHALWGVYGKPVYDVLMDPAGFSIKRTTTGHEHPSDADEYRAAAEKLGAEWFAPRPANNGDPMAYRVKRYLAADLVRVCEGMQWWRWEAARWVRQAPRAGLAASEKRLPEKPVDRNNHLMDPTRYLCNELPDPLPVPKEAPGPLQRHWGRLDTEPKRRKREGEWL
jgi:hypothetical protein